MNGRLAAIGPLLSAALAVGCAPASIYVDKEEAGTYFRNKFPQDNTELVKAAESCGSYINKARTGWLTNRGMQIAVTVLGGSLAAYGAYAAATADDDSSSSDTNTAAALALTGGVIAIVSQVLPDPVVNLRREEAGKEFWKRAILQTNRERALELLLNCQTADIEDVANAAAAGLFKLPTPAERQQDRREEKRRDQVTPQPQPSTAPQPQPGAAPQLQPSAAPQPQPSAAPQPGSGLAMRARSQALRN